MYVAVFLNTFRGKLEVYGPFDSEDEAQAWIDTKDYTDLWNVREVRAD